MSLQLKPWRICGTIVVLIALLALLTNSGILWVVAGTVLGILLVIARRPKPEIPAG